MRIFWVRFLPIVLISIGFFVVAINDFNQWLVLSTFIMICIYNSAVNVYLINKNIKKGIIWIRPFIDYILGIISSFLYFGILLVIYMKTYKFPIAIIFAICMLGIVVYLEYKLKISEYKNGKHLRNSDMHDYKVVSNRTEKIFKNTTLALTIISILLIIMTLYLKWWILFGMSIGLLIIVAIVLTIYEKCFTTHIED